MLSLKSVSCGAIIFRENSERKFLLLLNGKYFKFVTGRIEKGEEEKDTVKREIEEETGITDIKFIDGFREIYNFTYKLKGDLILREIVLYLVETKTEDVRISYEHDSFKWLTFEEAIELIKFKNMKELLIKANDFINSSL